ncbi:MAG TPA: carboxypeptidase-like regulatory domain-containing protein, partial [Planctomycetota bacterium]|nr:carboxypeptidase-like regulatory domain-containing protein [Planctomycetota bacterium]
TECRIDHVVHDGEAMRGQTGRLHEHTLPCTGRDDPMPSRALATSLLLSLPVLAQSGPAAMPAAEPTLVLEGRVVDLRGEGVPLAKISIATLQDRDHEVARGVCDGEGFFRLGRVPPAQGWLARAHVEGMCCQLGFATEVGSPMQVTMHDAATVRGVLRDAAGALAPGVIVRAVHASRALQPEDCLATTDAQGRFTLTRVPLGPIAIAAAVPGEGLYELRTRVTGDCDVCLLPARHSRTTLSIVATGLPPDAPTLVYLRQGIDGEGRLLPPGTWLPTLAQPWHRPTLAADGTCTLRDVPDGDYSVSLRVQGYVIAPDAATARSGRGPHVLSFTATPLGKLECHAALRDGNGTPLAGVQLTLRHRRVDAVATSDGDGMLMFTSTGAAGSQASVVSLDDRWVLDQTKAEGMNGWVFPSAWHEHECVIDPGVTLQLRVARACSVRGRLLARDGRAAPFVRLELQTEQTNRGPRWQRVALATTDRDGRFHFRRLHALVGDARVLVPSGPGPLASEPFVLREPGTEHTVPDMRLPTPTMLMGSAVRSEGHAVPGLLVRWETESGGNLDIVEVLTDRLGRYRLAGLPPGKGTLKWLADEQEPIGAQPMDLASGTSQTIDLQLPAK